MKDLQALRKSICRKPEMNQSILMQTEAGIRFGKHSKILHGIRRDMPKHRSRKAGRREIAGLTLSIT